MIDVLVIGYGNGLRSDDGAGPAVADAVDALHLPGVHTLAVHQLTPELAEAIGRHQRVVFVDAALDEAAVRIDRIAPKHEIGPPMTHRVDPSDLLALAGSVGQAPREAYQVAVPADDLGFGEALSTRTRAAVDRAVEAIVGLSSAAAEPSDGS